MSIHYKPDAATERRYDREAEQYVKYVSGCDSHGTPDPFCTEGNEAYAETASIPTFRALDKKMAAEGEP